VGKMNEPTKNEKRNFLTWYMMRHEWKDVFQNEIASMIYRHFPENVKFAEGVEYERTYIIMPTKNSNRDFVFHNGYTHITSPYEAYKLLNRSIELFQHTTIYVEVENEEPSIEKTYREVLEEAPSNPYKKEAERMLKELFEKLELQKLQRQIDEALDTRNIPRFLELSSLLKDMQTRQAIEPEGEAI
jgi:uncharacterized protein YpiB (UPF0302 family)